MNPSLTHLSYSDPWPTGPGPQDHVEVVHFLAKVDAIKLQKWSANYTSRGFREYNSDEEALLDFITINWASECSEPIRTAQPQPEPVGWLDAPYAVFRANPNWQWESGPTTLSASIPVFLHPAPQPEAVRIALSVAKGALGMCKPCAERDCKAEQQAWIDEALAAIERAIRKGD